MNSNKKNNKTEFIEYFSDYYNLRNLKEEWDMPIHSHNVYELYYLFNGHVQYNIDGEIYDISGGDLVFIPPNVLHKTTSLSLEHQRFVINFKKESVPKNILSAINKAFETNCLKVPHKKRTQIERMFIEINEEIEINDEYSKENVDLGLRRLLIFIIRNAPKMMEERVKSVPVFVNDIVEFIKLNYHDDISLAVIAKHINMNEAYISRKFKEIVGRGISEYINVVRIEMAIKLLLQTNFSVTRIATDVGFNNSSYFASVFEQMIGVTPKKYRTINKADK